MSRVTRKRSSKQGAPPGTLVYIGEKGHAELKISVVDYNKQTLTEKSNTNLADCLTYLNQPASVTWINVSGLCEPKIIETLGQRFQWNPLVMEDILNTGQRPKCDDYKDYMYVVLRIFKKNGDIKIEDDQFSLILGKNYVVTFMEGPDDLLEPIRYRIRRNGSRMRLHGADYLAYAIVDTLVDSIFGVLEKIDEEVEVLEDELFKNPTPNILYDIQKFKREVALLRKNLWPLREAISGLERKENPLIQDTTRFFLRDVHDHTVLMIETVEGFRDILSGMIDIYLSSINLKMNEIMKVLTIVATIFVPLTFIASIYGMNFDYQPELHYHYGYYSVLGLMATIALFMLYYFHRKKWF